MGAVLIVEDDKEIRGLFCRMLHAEGYQTLEAGNGFEALEVLTLSEQNPRVIVLDLMMPVMDGRQFLEEVRKTRFRDIPVIVSSASMDRDIKGVEYIPKPIGVAEFLSKLAKHFG